jgi:V8-like Glu-specific endopeptidase
MRAIPDDNLAYPVLLLHETGASGSGFYLNAEDDLFLITARHVLFDPKTNKLLSEKLNIISYPKDLSDPGRIEWILDLGSLEANGKIKAHPDNDVAVVHIATKSDKDSEIEGVEGITIGQGITINSSTEAPLVHVRMAESTKSFDKVLIANEVLIFGFPTSIGLPNLPQFNRLRPLLRKGIVAGKNDDLKTIILDCPSYPGNSGGPVIEVEEDGLVARFRVIGIVTEFVPVAEAWVNTSYGYTNTSYGNSGYSVAMPMDFIYELVKEFQEEMAT